MKFKYYHDVTRKVVYRMPSIPTVIEKTDGHGGSSGWTVQSEIKITRADNVQIANSHQWRHRVWDNPQEHYDAKDSRAAAVGLFNTQHVPGCPEVDEATYEFFREKYENEARQNKDT